MAERTARTHSARPGSSINAPYRPRSSRLLRGRHGRVRRADPTSGKTIRAGRRRCAAPRHHRWTRPCAHWRLRRAGIDAGTHRHRDRGEHDRELFV